jgi:hypothetical protein
MSFQPFTISRQLGNQISLKWNQLARSRVRDAAQPSTSITHARIS